jgi:hypothetical protein
MTPTHADAISHQFAPMFLGGKLVFTNLPRLKNPSLVAGSAIVLVRQFYTAKTILIESLRWR